MQIEMQIDRLIDAIDEKNNPSVLGLDTRIEYIPDSFIAKHIDRGGAASVIRAFNFALLDALRDIIPCVKIQAAFYEMLGLAGGACLFDTIMEARRLGYVVILDAKRGDIGSTAAAYSAAYLAKDAPEPVDFLTVNPYLGIDGARPFIEDCDKTGRGIFVLIKTSNPSSSDFQDLILQNGEPLFMRVGKNVAAWGADERLNLIGKHGYSLVGAVIGATYPEQGAALRKIMPRTFFLLPGYGAQGANASGLGGCFDGKGRGAVVSASRSILCAHKKFKTNDFVSTAHDEAVRMRDDIRGAVYGR